MKNIKVYKERMDVCMTEDEKLFFVNYIDFNEIDTIVDFGGANGSLLWHLTQLRPETTKTKKVIVDNNPQMQTEYPLENVIRIRDIFEFKPDTLKGKVLFIFSSVLHECSRLLTYQLMMFCTLYAHAVVVRDMCYTKEAEDKQKFEDFPAYEVIRANSKLSALFDEHRLIAQQVWMQSPEEVLTHFILKYTYLENKETEFKENYFSNNADYLTEMLGMDCDWEYRYKRDYTLPYKAKQAAEVFNWLNMPFTHTQRVLVKKSK